MIDSNSDVIDALKSNVIGLYPDSRCFIKDDKIYIQLAIAGIDCNTIKIEIGKDTIKVSAKPLPTGIVIFDTIRAKPFERVIRVAQGYKVNKAVCENGMLSIVLEYPEVNDSVDVDSKSVNVDVVEEKKQPQRRNRRNSGNK